MSCISCTSYYTQFLYVRLCTRGNSVCVLPAVVRPVSAMEGRGRTWIATRSDGGRCMQHGGVGGGVAVARVGRWALRLAIIGLPNGRATMYHVCVRCAGRPVFYSGDISTFPSLSPCSQSCPELLFRFTNERGGRAWSATRDAPAPL